MINIKSKPEISKDLFFGTSDGISRLDLTYDSAFKRIAEKDEANTWFLNIVNCSNDRWNEFPPNALSKFQKNLAYQTVSDSLVPDVFSYLAQIANDPYLEYLYSRISAMEKTHAMSYSSGVDQAFGARATEFLDIIYTEPKIADRVEVELDVATRFIKAVQTGWEETDENKKLLLELISKVFILEGLKFPFSFYTSWSLNKAYNNCAQGFSQLLIKISIDEMTVHTTTGATILKRLKNSPKFKHLYNSGWFSDMFLSAMKDAVRREEAWSDFLLEDGETPGFNKQITSHFIKYWANRRTKEINLNPIYPNIQKNDIESWFDSYRNPNSKSSALQEISNVSYQLGQLKNDLHKFDNN